MFAKPKEAGDAIEARLARARAGEGGPAHASASPSSATWRRRHDAAAAVPASSADTFDWTGRPHIQTLTITGPFKPTGAGDTPSRRRIFVCRPRQRRRRSCRAPRQIIDTLARARLPPAGQRTRSAAAARLLRRGRRDGTFETGIQRALQAILASPKFVFRVERDPANAAPGAVYRISDLELASRLSFFLWSSIPDDELLDGRGRGPAARPGGARAAGAPDAGRPAGAGARSTTSPASGCSCATSRASSRTPTSSPTSTTTCGRRSARETELFFESIMREDRNVLDLLTADYTFVNERLARHYGIPDVYGSRFRRVAVTDEARKGLLGQGSILTLTSHAERTSPVVRGKWILENLLGTPPPPPPPDVPALKDKDEGDAAEDDAGADGGAPRQSGLRELPQGDGPDRLRAGELRRRRRLAHAGGRRADRRRPASSPTARAWTAWSTLRQALLQPARGVRRHDDREAADLRARPRARPSRHAGGARDRPRRGAARTTGSRRSCWASSTACRSRCGSGGMQHGDRATQRFEAESERGHAAGVSDSASTCCVE